MTSKGMTIDVGGWLRGLGLGQYEAAFRENNIDDAVLPSLTAEDLKDLGIGTVGHRRKLLDAIAVLRADSRAPPPASPSAPPSTAAAMIVPEAVGERRYVTVLFCDLMDSTGSSGGASRCDRE